MRDYNPVDDFDSIPSFLDENGEVDVDWIQEYVNELEFQAIRDFPIDFPEEYERRCKAAEKEKNKAVQVSNTNNKFKANW